MFRQLRYDLSRLRVLGYDHALELLIAVAVLLAAVIGLAARPVVRAEVVTVVATPTLGLALPTAAPLPTAEAVPGLPRAAVAYAAPDGATLGALEQGRPYIVLARYGAEWLQVDAGSGSVWVRADEAGLIVDAALADLAPPPAPQVVYVAAPPPVAAPMPLEAPAPAQEAPAVYSAASVAPTADPYVIPAEEWPAAGPSSSGAPCTSCRIDLTSGPGR